MGHKHGTRHDLWLMVDPGNFFIRGRTVLLHNLDSKGHVTTRYFWNLKMPRGRRPLLMPGDVLKGRWMVETRKDRKVHYKLSSPRNLQVGEIHEWCGEKGELQRPVWVWKSKAARVAHALPEFYTLPFKPHWYLVKQLQYLRSTYQERVPTLWDTDGDILMTYQFHNASWFTRMAVQDEATAELVYTELLQGTRDHEGYAARYRVPDHKHWVVSFKTPSREVADQVRDYLKTVADKHAIFC